MVTAAAGPEAGGSAKITIEEEMANHEYFCVVADNVEEEPSFHVRSPIGSHASGVETRPTTVDNVARSKYKEV